MEFLVEAFQTYGAATTVCYLRLDPHVSEA